MMSLFCYINNCGFGRYANNLQNSTEMGHSGSCHNSQSHMRQNFRGILRSPHILKSKMLEQSLCLNFSGLHDKMEKGGRGGGGVKKRI